MATTFSIDPVSRIEGHLKIEVTVDDVGGTQQVIDAKSSGTMFRGFENILIGRAPYDATHITQRICGVCPVSHGMASSKTLESALGATVPTNGRVMRNLVLGANFIQSHILHFYHLAALDYINTTGLLDMPPWSYRHVTADMASGDDAARFVTSYVQALAIRRKAHQMGAIFGGKLPCTPSFAAGGCTDFLESGDPTDKVAGFSSLLTEIRTFIDNTFIPDVEYLASLFSNYYSMVGGSGKLLAYGAFDLASGKLFEEGYYDGATTATTLDITKITEDVDYSWFTSGSGLNPAAGETVSNPEKPGAYSFIKAPRYNGNVCELGPLARMWIKGEYTNGISAMDRIAARAYETKLIADTLVGWLGELTDGADSFTPPTPAEAGTGVGLTEAPRGALGHWITIDDSKISRYQVITPTAWNCSPMDDAHNKGPVEQALIGTEVAEIDQPVEILRIIHSFDPCLACSVHMLRPDQKKAVNIIEVPAGL